MSKHDLAGVLSQKVFEDDRSLAVASKIAGQQHGIGPLGGIEHLRKAGARKAAAWRRRSIFGLGKNIGNDLFHTIGQDDFGDTNAGIQCVAVGVSRRLEIIAAAADDQQLAGMQAILGTTPKQRLK